MRLVLASTSPYRRELLSRLGVPFEVASPDVDETPLAGESPDDTAQRLSLLKDKAVEQLREMRGKTLEFHTALTLFNAKTGNTQTANVPVRLVMRDYGDDQIEAYLRKDRPYNCCGSARSESLGIALIARYETEDPNALVGLPLIKLTEMLANEGLDVLTWQPAPST
jgi:septum formation protein